MGGAEKETTPGAADPESSGERPRSGVWWVSWLIIIPLLYVLSVGPVAKLAEVLRSRRLQGMATVVYSPLRLVYFNSSAARHFFDWYLGIWGVR